MRAAGPLALIVALLAGQAWADTLTRSVLPQPRPKVEAAEEIPAVQLTDDVIRPRKRPPGVKTASGPEAPPQPGLTSVLRPHPRPKGLLRQADDLELASADPAPVKRGKDKKTKRGSVCGDPDIKGEALAPISSKTRGCGVSEPVRVTSIDGIPFSQPATFDCETAIALKQWIRKGMRPAFGNREVVQLHIFGSYMCRTRNNVKGAKISEHGRGKAVDIAGFVFSDGKEWTIARDYNKTIRKAQKAACGIFGTTLGPGSDGYHEDHLHFDTAGYRSGPYCR